MKLRSIVAASAIALLLPFTASADPATCSPGPSITCTSTLQSSTPELWTLVIGPGSGAFSVTTAPSLIDTQLFLFDSTFHGVASNDDNGIAPNWWSSTITRNLGASLVSRVFYLAVSEYDMDPLSNSQMIFNANQGSAPGSGAPIPGAGAFDPYNPEWLVSGYTTGGDYTLRFTGVAEAGHYGGETPEPATLTLLGTGLAGLVARARRRRQAAAATTA